MVKSSQRKRRAKKDVCGEVGMYGGQEGDTEAMSDRKLGIEDGEIEFTDRGHKVAVKQTLWL